MVQLFLFAFPPDQNIFGHLLFKQDSCIQPFHQQFVYHATVYFLPTFAPSHSQLPVTGPRLKQPFL